MNKLYNYMSKIKENVVFELEDKLVESWSVNDEKIN